VTTEVALIGALVVSVRRLLFSNLDIGLRAYHDQHFLEADVSLYCFRLHAYP